MSLAYILYVCAAMSGPCQKTEYPSDRYCYAALERVRFYNPRDYAYCRPK